MDLSVLYKLRFLAFVSFFAVMTGCTNLLFQPTKNLVVTPSRFGIEYQDVYFKSIDNLSLHGWWLPAQEESKAVVVFLHGNGENISTHSAAVYWLIRHQYDVFVFDYRGYGLSQGMPDLDLAMTDIYQAFAYSIKRKGGDKKLFVIGHSMGASMGIYAIAQKPEAIDGAIFVSPFSDYREITRDVLSKHWLTWLFQWPVSLTISNDYRPLDFVKSLPDIPILYIYSNEDGVISPYQVKDLYDNSKPPKSIERVDGSHNSIFGTQINRDIVLKYLNQWLEYD